jgi:hypothetical protein
MWLRKPIIYDNRLIALERVERAAQRPEAHPQPSGACMGPAQDPHGTVLVTVWPTEWRSGPRAGQFVSIHLVCVQYDDN